MIIIDNSDQFKIKKAIQAKYPMMELDRLHFLPTEDDWHPNFPGGYVSLYWSTPPVSGGWILVVSGADDDMCNKGYSSRDLMEAELKQLIEQGQISKVDLIDRGFEW